MNASTRPPRRLQKKGTMEEDDPVNLRDYQEIARRILPKMNYDFFSGGAEDEFTLRENVEAFQRIMPRILVDVSKIDMSTVLLGYHMSSPILVAPTGAQQLAHSDGFFCPRELATTRAAAACKTIMVLSTSSSYSIKEVASACDAIRFFQLYVNKKREITESLVKRAERNGYRAIVLTVDTPKLGRREADIRNKMIAPKLGNVEGLISVDTSAADGSKLEAYGSQFFDPSLSWKDIEWLKCITRLPIVVKGIITADDAVRAVECGVFGIVFSNHGARQLDYVPCIISVLEEVVKAVSGAIPVLLDGGVGRGTDVSKALAVGAKAVLIGRPVVYGLAAKGEEGVGRVIKMLQDELELTMALAGCPCLKHITRNHVVVNNHGRPRSLL